MPKLLTSFKRPVERYFEFTTTMIIGFEGLEDVVKAFLKKGPETVDRTVVQDLILDVGGPVMIGFEVLAIVDL